MPKVLSDKENLVKRLVENKPSVFLWLYLPLLILAATIAVEAALPMSALEVIFSENGPYELLQVVFSTMAFVYALFLLPKINWTTQKLAGIAVLLAAIGSFYITGEEISWGQQILKWDTPAYWSTVNDQNETNLHNTSAWLDQKPRLLLFLGIVIAGLIVPALRRWKPSSLPAQYAVLYPKDCLAVTAGGVLIPYLVHELGEHIIGRGIFHRVSEVQELYIYYFVLLYLVDLKNRVISQD